MQITYWNPINSCWSANPAPPVTPVAPPPVSPDNPPISVTQPLPTITTGGTGPAPPVVLPAPPQDCSMPLWWLALIGVAMLAGSNRRGSK